MERLKEEGEESEAQDSFQVWPAPHPRDRDYNKFHLRNRIWEHERRWTAIDCESGSKRYSGKV